MSNNKILEVLKLTLANWFKDSELDSLYLVGSFTTGEYNNFSDIDLLGITKNKNETVNAIAYRKYLQHLINKIEDYRNINIGLRLRHSSELIKFNNHMCSWGYNNINAKLLFGNKVNWNIAEYESTPSKLLDNINVELRYYNQKYSKMKNKNEILYCNCKGILNALHFYLISKGVQLYTHEDRVAFAITYKMIPNHILSKSILMYCLNSKLGKRQSDSIEIDIDRHNFLVFTFYEILKVKEVGQYEKSKTYWGIFRDDNQTINIIKKLHIEKDLFRPETIRRYSYRILLFLFLVSVDKLRLGCLNSHELFNLNQIQKSFFKPIGKFSRIKDKSDITDFINQLDKYMFLNDKQFRDDFSVGE